ncbi:MAG: hypothetical protein QM756_12810 [Polyangiaceae bacterium]
MTLGRLARRNSGVVVGFCFSVAFAAALAGCGSNSDDPGGSGGSGGSGGNGSGTGGTVSTPDCTGAFTKIPTPYSANTAFDDLGAFAIDDKGLVFSALPDEDLGAKAGELPNVLMATDLTGNVITLRESTAGFFSNPVFDGDDVIVTEGFANRQLVRMPRTGGSVTVLVEGIRDGAFADATSLYYLGYGPDGGGLAVYSLPRAGGTPKLLSDRGSMGIRGFAFEGDTLYWAEQKSLLEDPVNVYSMKVGATEPTLLAAIPSDTSGGLTVSGGVLFSTLLTDDFDFDTYRIDAGKAPTLMGETGLPFLLADGKAYYASTSGGITRNSLAFDSPSSVSGTAGKSIYAIGSGPTDLWYAVQGCIYRTAK